MSSIKTITIPLIVLFLMLGCSVKQEADLKPYEKAFEAEDAYIVKALEQEDSEDFEGALESYRYLYAQSGKWEYNIKTLQILFKLKRFDEAEVEMQKSLQKRPDDEKLLRTMVSLSVHQKRTDEALRYALKLLEKERSEKYYELVASIYFSDKQFEQALQYLESAYALHQSTRILEKITNTLYYFLNRKEEGTAYMETHIRTNGCDQRLCEKLSNLYRGQKDVDNMLAIFKRLYETYKEKLYAKNIVELYVYKEEYDKAVAFLQETHADDAMLLEIYRAKKDYKAAKELAAQLHTKTNEMDFLAQEAVFEYENAKDKNSAEMLTSVTTKLYKALESMDDDVYQNFLGYILIDHDLDYKNGIRLVRLALEKKPDSAYYIDSLAWGYYKLKKCKEAYIQMKKVVDMVGLDEEEVADHWNKIQACHTPESKKEENP